MRIQEADKYVLRLPDGLRDKIKVSAAANRRSMNAEMIYHLEKAMPSASQNEKGDVTAS